MIHSCRKIFPDNWKNLKYIERDYCGTKEIKNVEIKRVGTKNQISWYKSWCVLSWGHLSAVISHICIIQEANKFATRSFRDIRKFWKGKNYSPELTKLLLKIYGRKLKLAENKSKSTLLISPAWKLRWTIDGYHQEMSRTFCLTVSHYRKISKGALLVFLKFSGTAYLLGAKIWWNIEGGIGKNAENLLSREKKIARGTFCVWKFLVPKTMRNGGITIFRGTFFVSQYRNISQNTSVFQKFRYWKFSCIRGGSRFSVLSLKLKNVGKG